MPPTVASYVFEPARFRTNLFRYYRPTDSLDLAIERFRQLVAAGIPIAVGTDSGSPANFHIDAIWWDLETWRKLGVPPERVIQAATAGGAKLLNDPAIGSIQVGARGDLVLLKGKLNQPGFALDRVRMVAKGGKVFVKDGQWVEP